jgi:hypothetical protein
MVVADNKTRDQLWHQLLTLGPIAKTSSEEMEDPAGVDKIENLAAAEVYPNPFNPRTAIRFHLIEAAPVRLQIFNIAGQLVRTLVDNELPAGVHQRHWNARNQDGESVATGTYIYRLQIGERFIRGRMQLVK